MFWLSWVSRQPKFQTLLYTIYLVMPLFHDIPSLSSIWWMVFSLWRFENKEPFVNLVKLKCTLAVICVMITLKGHWTTSASSPIFFQKIWDFYTIRNVYLCSGCMLNLTCNFNLITKICEFFLQQPFFKVYFQKWPPMSCLLNLATSTIILVLTKILKLVCAVLWTDTKIN